MDYFEHNAGKLTSWALVEWVEPEPVVVAETDDEAEVARVREMWKRRVDQCS